jgi:hypothetical protein
MAIERVLMLIADIGGYTRFMNVHRLSLAHAQEVVGRLLDAVIEASDGMFEVAKLEGDAVFLYARLPANREPDLEPFTAKVRLIRQKFLERQQEYGLNRLCTCDGCVQVAQLKLKFVSHLGEAAFQRIRRFNELAGVDVILVHRMLKNSVPVSEYVLMTDPIHDRLAPSLKEVAKHAQEEFEGLGLTQTHYIDLNDVALGTLPEFKPTLLGKIWQWLQLNVRSIPYILGVRKPCQGFRHVDEHVGGLLPPNTSQEPVGEGVRQ